MKAWFSYSPAEVVSVFVPLSLKSYNQVKRAAGCLANARRKDASVAFWLGHSNATFMRVRGEEFDQARRRSRIAQQVMNRLDLSDSLIVSITSRVIIRPGYCQCVPIVSCALRLIGVQVRRVEEMRGADAANRADGRAQILMIAARKRFARIMGAPTPTLR
jgi:hypothetical protein